MTPPTIASVIRSIKSRGYTLYTEPYRLNIVGIRNSNPTELNKFDDYIAFFYFDKAGQPIGKVATATTDPSTYYLENPFADTEGTAILKSGEYKNAYMIGLHKGQYEALIQTGAPVVVMRDNDRNSYLNYFAPTRSGFYGINIHRARVGVNLAQFVDKWSAGCQVFQSEKDFQMFMSFAKKSRDMYGNKFTYILIDERDLLKTINTSILGIALVISAFYLYSKAKK